MFQKFEEYFKISSPVTDRKYSDALMAFREKYQGMDFGEGIYRVFRQEEIEKWKTIISEGYPDFTNKFDPFAYDWLGRCFAMDLRNNSLGNILMFEIGTADVLNIPCNIVEFHNEEIPMYHESCLATSFFAEWKEVTKQVLEHNKCAGYKIPLFLGGSDEISNLELSDMEVYWFICSAAKNRK
ncbi:MAG: DUF1851 domain-containing protein [Clostridiales bacterium]|nr:DUF1851 domain-containing protein [Clostridiales bacterium]